MINKLSNNCLIFKIFVVVVILLYSWAAFDFASARSSKPIASGNYQIIYVTKGDTIWTIAAKHVSDKEDIRPVVEAIIEFNALANDVKIYPGQSLKIPPK
jgi:nucleoid-associated protein YgaU